MDVRTLIAAEDELIYSAAMRGREGANISALAAEVHSAFLTDLFFTFVSARFGRKASRVMSICFDADARACHRMDCDDIEALPALCEELHISFLNSRFALSEKGPRVRYKSKEQLIALGAVYTQARIAERITDRAMAMAGKPAGELKILDFACGTGRFFDSILRHFPSPSHAVLHNIYAADIDRTALHITRLKALAVFDDVTPGICRTISRHIAVKDLLRVADTAASDDFERFSHGGFDVIVSNPPYLVLKPDKSKAGAGSADSIKAMVDYFRKCGHYHHSVEGMLNLYKLSVERMLTMLRPGGTLGVICPSTLFGDVSATKLRRHLLLDNSVTGIEFFSEKTGLFDNVTQATNIFYLCKGSSTDSISIAANGEEFTVSLALVRELFPDNLEIPAIKAREWDVLRKLLPHTRLGKLPEVRNRRGELDLTLCRRFITTEPTPYRLVRGNMIGSSGIRDINGEYVDERFIATRTEEYRRLDFNRRRLVCQQVSNGGLRRRLRFVFCDEADVLGNSCNYLSADGDTLARLHVVLNSSLLNWRFKITSSNNHINNYELDELPIVDLRAVDPSLTFASQEELDEYVGGLYGLSAEERKIVNS